MPLHTFYEPIIGVVSWIKIIHFEKLKIKKWTHYTIPLSKNKLVY